MSTGQHRRSGGPLRERLAKFMSSASGSHRRRKHDQARSTARTAKEHTHGGYQTSTAHPGTAA